MIQKYRPSSNSWVNDHSTFFPRFAHAAVLLPNGQNVVWAGGFNSAAASTTTQLATWFNPRTDLNMLTDRALFGDSLLRNGAVLVVAGFKTGSDAIAATERPLP